MRGLAINRNKLKRIEFLRSRGYSLPEISQLTKVPKSTVFRYVNDIKILPEYLDNWYGKRGGRRKRKERKILAATQEGKKLVKRLSIKEKVLVLAMLYWAEGGKNDFNFTNTDGEMVRVFVKILKEKFMVNDDRLRINLRLYEDLDEDICKEYWAKIIGIPTNQILSINRLPGKKMGKLKYGMCRVRILKGGDVLKQINGIIKAVSGVLSP